MKTKSSLGWEVYLNGKNIDTVFYAVSCDKDYVKSSLINHDGYDPGITVRLSKEDCEIYNNFHNR